VFRAKSNKKDRCVIEGGEAKGRETGIKGVRFNLRTEGKGNKSGEEREEDG